MRYIQWMTRQIWFAKRRNGGGAGRPLCWQGWVFLGLVPFLAGWPLGIVLLFLPAQLSFWPAILLLSAMVATPVQLVWLLPFIERRTAR